MRRFKRASGVLSCGVAASVIVSALLVRPPAVRGDGQAGAASKPGAKTPFAGVPSGDPAYAVVECLASDGGLFVGFADGSFSGQRGRTRYEFGIAVQRLHEDLRRKLGRLDPPKSALRGVPSFPPPPSQERIAEGLKDPARREKLLAWYAPLLAELPDVLRLLGMDPERAGADLEAWRESAARSAKAAGAKAEKSAQPAGAGTGEAAAGGPFSDLPLSSPAYSTVDLLMKLGVFSGYSGETFQGKRPLTRYEFAVATQRMARELGRYYDPVQPRPGAVIPSGPIDRFGPAPAVSLEDTMQDPALRTRVLAWYLPLLTEFAGELRMMGMEPDAIRAKVEAWQEAASPAPTPEATGG